MRLFVSKGAALRTQGNASRDFFPRARRASAVKCDPVMAAPSFAPSSKYVDPLQPLRDALAKPDGAPDLFVRVRALPHRSRR